MFNVGDCGFNGVGVDKVGFDGMGFGEVGEDIRKFGVVLIDVVCGFFEVDCLGCELVDGVVIIVGLLFECFLRLLVKSSIVFRIISINKFIIKLINIL